MAESPSAFELDPATYDALIDWPRRLAREEPFYRRLFSDHDVRRVADVACGTGHHAAMFRDWGLAVLGADLSPVMIDYCRARHGESDTLRWTVRGLGESPPPGEPFDAVLCVGNSLPLVESIADVTRALRGMMALLRPGGVCVVQVLNLWRLREGPTLWQKCQRLRDTDRDRVILKGVHRAGELGHIDFVELTLHGDTVDAHTHTSELLALRADRLLLAGRSVGGQQAELFGDYERNPFDAAGSTDLIMTCQRA